MFSLNQRRQSGEMIAVFMCPKGWHIKEEEGLLLVAPEGRIRSNGLKLVWCHDRSLSCRSLVGEGGCKGVTGLHGGQPGTETGISLWTTLLSTALLSLALLSSLTGETPSPLPDCPDLPPTATKSSCLLVLMSTRKSGHSVFVISHENVCKAKKTHLISSNPACSREFPKRTRWDQ